jgi:sugar/nucleoside kinase (ribokinase family)
VENTKYHIEKSAESGGGPAATAAYLLSKWGVKAAYAGLLGKDLFGQLILDEFKSVGADTSLVEMEPNYSTPLSMVIVNTTTGSRTIINRTMKKRTLKLKKPPRAAPTIILVDGHELDAGLEAFQAYPEAVTVLDAGSLREATEKFVEKVDYPVCSERFAIEYASVKDLKSEENISLALNKIFNANGKHAIITLGSRGVVFLENGRFHHIPAFKVKAIDTTGAGDIFHGAFAYGRYMQMGLKEIIRFAAMTAAISVTRQGNRQSIPERREVEETLQKNGDYTL